MADVGEARLGGDLFCPLLHGPALDLHAAPAVSAGQGVGVHARLALPVEDLAAGVADRVDAAVLAQRLQVPVDGRQPDVLAPAPQLRVDLLGTAEARQALQRGRQGLRLPGPARPGSGPHGLLRLRHRHSRTVQPSPPLRPTRATPQTFLDPPPRRTARPTPTPSRAPPPRRAPHILPRPPPRPPHPFPPLPRRTL